MIKFNDVMTKADWVKIVVLIILSSVAWTWVYIEYQKPIIPADWEISQDWEY